MWEHTCTPDLLQCQVIGWDQPQPGGLSWFTSCRALLKQAGPDLRNQLALPVLMSFPVLCSLGHHAGVWHHQREVLRQHQELDSQYRGGRPRPFDVTWLLLFSELTLFRVGFEEVFRWTPHLCSQRNACMTSSQNHVICYITRWQTLSIRSGWAWAIFATKNGWKFQSLDAHPKRLAAVIAAKDGSTK